MTLCTTLQGNRTLKSLAAPTLNVWADELDHARKSDRSHGTVQMTPQTRRSHHHREFRMVVIFQNSRGRWGLLDRDSGEILLGGTTRDAAVSFAARWHSEKPTHREVAIFRDDAQALVPARLRRSAAPLPRRVAAVPVSTTEVAMA